MASAKSLNVQQNSAGPVIAALAEPGLVITLPCESEPLPPIRDPLGFTPPHPAGNH